MLDATTDAGARAERRLREEKVAWLTTVRADGQPPSVPVWFLWDWESFLVYSQPERQKLKNIGKSPRVGLHLNCNDRSGFEPEGFARACSVALRVTPTRLVVW